MNSQTCSRMTGIAMIMPASSAIFTFRKNASIGSVKMKPLPFGSSAFSGSMMNE